MGKVIAPGESLVDVLKEASAFFAKEGPVYDALARLTRHLSNAGIDYAIIGGMAMAAHGYMRFTADVDVLIAAENLDLTESCLVAAGYKHATGRRWHDVAGTAIDLFPRGDPAAVSMEIDGIRVVRLEKLIDYKLAAGLANPHRLHDLADVQRLIEGLDLPLDFAQKLDPSVRDTFIEYWHAIQNATGPDRE
jgi:hypothetical protein